MGLRSWWRDVSARPTWDGTSGRPPSGNGASSFHLAWDAGAGPWRAVDVTFEVVDPPAVDRLYFWALQVSFVDGTGRAAGGAHLGPQWCTNPTRPAVNWGGYGAGGGELTGSTSHLPSSWNNANTRDYDWVPGRPYRLRVAPAAAEGQAAAPNGTTAWRGTITDLDSGVVTAVRDLWARGDRLTSPMVWSEVFADCDDPSVTVRWSDVTVEGLDGTRTPVRHVRVNYQSLADGGCRSTNSSVDVRSDDSHSGDAVRSPAFLQATSVSRTTAQGARLP